MHTQGVNVCKYTLLLALTNMPHVRMCVHRSYQNFLVGACGVSGGRRSGGRPAGNDVVATISHRRSALIQKVGRSAQKPRGRQLSRPHRPFWDPLAAILDFAGVAGKCPLRC